MIGPGNIKAGGQLRILNPANTICVLANEFYKIAGTFEDGETVGFTIAENKICWNGNNGIDFLFNGSSDVQVNKACTITYALFKNGILIPNVQTPHKFLSPSKTSNISITALVEINNNDEFDVYVKSDSAGTIVSVQTFNITLWR
jgi:hypothetical protein